MFRDGQSDVGGPSELANAYVFCVLEQFHARLRRRDIFAAASLRWADPVAQLLDTTPGRASAAGSSTICKRQGPH
ncbi:hypothetical protein Val02_66160 [Virgisporangium aliadipatigenens]|uniref:Uncharacterized protein n=1 Tax=Virgisporangium aliadipatigenens TaxID=741659 RepID=A0A8J3YTR8_9ACTN|nr:hypothetical protein Val02_66160 [Virgisporangium aliadipatigenens]